MKSQPKLFAAAATDIQKNGLFLVFHAPSRLWDLRRSSDAFPECAVKAEEIEV